MTEKDKSVKIIQQMINRVTNNKTYPFSFENKNKQDNFIYLINYHQISPIFHYFKNYLPKPPTIINEKILLKSQEAFLQNLCRSMLYIDFLKQPDLPDFFLVKGLVSAHLLYSSPALRSFNDLDILIEKKHYNDWIDFLNTAGFKQKDNLSDTFPNRIIKKYNFAQHFVNEDNNIAIDLHLNLSNKLHPFQFDLSEFTATPKTFTIEGVKIKTFDNEHLLIYMLYHAFKHYYFKILWFIDIHNFFMTQPYDEQKILDLIKKHKLQVLFRYYLGISIDLFGETGLDENSALRKHFQPKRDHIINLTSVIRGELSSGNSTNRLLLPMKYLPKASQKFKYLIKQLFPPAETQPEFYKNSGRLSRWDYLMNRFTKLKRLDKFNQ